MGFVFHKTSLCKDACLILVDFWYGGVAEKRNGSREGPRATCDHAWRVAFCLCFVRVQHQGAISLVALQAYSVFVGVGVFDGRLEEASVASA